MFHFSASRMPISSDCLSVALIAAQHKATATDGMLYGCRTWN